MKKDNGVQQLVAWTNQQVANLLPMSARDLKEARDGLFAEADRVADDPLGNGQLEMKIMITLGLIAYRLSVLEPDQGTQDIPSVFKNLF